MKAAGRSAPQCEAKLGAGIEALGRIACLLQRIEKELEHGVINLAGDFQGLTRDQRPNRSRLSPSIAVKRRERVDRRGYERGVTLDFSRPGKRTDNGLVKSFNGRLRDECLDTHWFLSLEDARTKIEAWWRDYNASRPHSAPGHLTPQEFAARAAQQACS